MTLKAAIAAAVDRASGLVETGPLEQAAAVLGEPWRVAIVGRTSVGKSTLVNWLLREERQPVGMGGVTAEPVELDRGDRVWIDTPGIDDPDVAITVLGPVLDRADGVIWVVDGLQPLTASERRVAEVTLPEGGPVDLVVGKADLLEPNERQGVVERVRSLADPWAPVSLRALDLRAALRDRLDPGDLGRPRLPGTRRLAVVRRALETTRHAVSALPPAPGLAAILDAWRGGVRAATEAVEARIASGEIRNKADALAALAEASPDAADAVAELVPDVPGLPVIEAPEVSAFGQVIAGMSGREGARRVLRAEAARWLAEGMVVLQDWAEGEDDRWEAHRARVALDEGLDAIAQALAAS